MSNALLHVIGFAGGVLVGFVLGGLILRRRDFRLLYIATRDRRPQPRHDEPEIDSDGPMT